MKMTNAFAIAAALLALAFPACSGNRVRDTIRTVSVSPSGGRYSSRSMAEDNDRVVNALRTAIEREIGNSSRFEPGPSGTGDAVIAIDTLRHGLVEAGAGNYSVKIWGNVIVTERDRRTTRRSFSGVSGIVRPYDEFENTKLYEEAVQGVADKIALELITTL